MTKYYCDLCGREVQSVEEYVLPDLGNKEFKNKQGIVIRELLYICLQKWNYVGIVEEQLVILYT